MWNTIKLLPFGTSTRCQYPSQRALSDISSRIVNNYDKPMNPNTHTSNLCTQPCKSVTQSLRTRKLNQEGSMKVNLMNKFGDNTYSKGTNIGHTSRINAPLRQKSHLITQAELGRLKMFITKYISY